MARDFIEALIDRAESADEGDDAPGLDPSWYPRREAALQLYEMFVNVVPKTSEPTTELNIDSRLVVFVANRFREIVEGTNPNDALLLKGPAHRPKAKKIRERDRLVIIDYYRNRLSGRSAEETKDEISKKKNITIKNVERIIAQRTFEDLMPLALEISKEDRRKLFGLAFPDKKSDDDS